METVPEGDAIGRGRLARLAPLPWLLIGGLVVAAGVGVAVGMEHAWLASEPSGMWPANLFYDLFTGAVVGVLAIVGLIASARGSRRGRNLLAGILAFGVGWVGGDVFGPRWQGPRDVTGTFTLNLLVPAVATLTGRATCTTEANGDRIVALSAERIGSVGIDAVGLRVEGGLEGFLMLRVNGLHGYEGPLTEVESSADTLTGSAAFVATSDGARFGGPTGSSTASGTLAWRCDPPDSEESPTPESTAGGSAPRATPLVLQDAIQGYFDLHGLVEWVTCPPTGGCHPYGHATGACSTALDLRTDGIETVVPWTDDRQARLHVVPGREASTLTITLDDGSAPESVEAATTLTEVQVGPWISPRRVEGNFELAAGTLHLFVEWDCGDQFEEVP